MKANPIHIVVGKTHRKVGYVYNDVFVTVRDEEQHAYRGGRKNYEKALSDNSLAWGIDASLCDKLSEKMVTKVVIVGRKAVYKTKIDSFRNVDSGRFVLNHKPHGTQYFVPFSVFQQQELTQEYIQKLVRVGVSIGPIL